MPKVLENVKEKLVAQARKQIMEEGYSAMSIRSVAKACGIAVGTVYNYFPSKEKLVASFMLEDWMGTVALMKERCGGSARPLDVLSVIHDGLKSYMKQNEKLFRDPEAGADFASSVSSRHGLLIGQLKELFQEACSGSGAAEDPVLSDFIMETLLLWTMQEKNFSDYCNIVGRLLA